MPVRTVPMSSNAFASLLIGNNFTQLVNGGRYTIPAAGWLQVDVAAGSLSDPGVAGTTFYSQTLDFTPPAPFAASNLQSILMVQ